MTSQSKRKKTPGGSNSLKPDGTPRYMPSPEVNAPEKSKPKPKPKPEPKEAPEKEPEVVAPPKVVDKNEHDSPNRLTVDVIKSISRYAKQHIAEGIVENQDVLDKYEIFEGPRRQMFLAQLAHESDGFKTTREYASGRAYEGRRDLGNTRPGDGTRFRGRGLIQLTGRFNYTKYGNIMNVNLVDDPDLAEAFPLALEVAAVYWSTHNLNALADQGEFRKITRIINGGYNGMADRNRYLAVTENLNL